MNVRLLSKSLGLIALLIGGAMLFSLPWAVPSFGYRFDVPKAVNFETVGCLSLLASVAVCWLVGGCLLWWGRKSQGHMFRKEAMAVVGLSWVLATVLGALPYYFAGVGRGPAARIHEDGDPALLATPGALHDIWTESRPLNSQQFAVVQALLKEEARGLSAEELRAKTDLADADQIAEELAGRPAWKDVILLPNSGDAPKDRVGHYRIRYVHMGIADSLFESQSGFSTTGATVISDLEDPEIVPHCILFWRSSTHFLGGLGIIVLFVVILGQGSAGKAMMRAEMPGPTKEGATARMQHTAWLFAGMYCALNLILSVILWFQNMSLFDATCHAFGTMATGGFSTYNDSVGHFKNPVVDYIIVVFMILAGTNFTLMYFVLARKPERMWADVEWRAYMAILVLVTVLVIAFGMIYGNFGSFSEALRLGLFQVVSITTTTGFGTHDFDSWNHFGRGVLFLLMFVGGCSGSTGGGLKVIRHVLFIKVLRLDIERSFHPNVVRPLRLGGKPVEDPELGKSILVYFGLITVIFVFSWLTIVAVEPDATWGNTLDNKIVDSASATAATLNNIGPGLGTVGATRNYGHFSALTKLLFVWLMMLGRLELFSILVLFTPAFWRSR